MIISKEDVGNFLAFLKVPEPEPQKNGIGYLRSILVYANACCILFVYACRLVISDSPKKTKKMRRQS